ncbi:ATP synthase F0 subunit A [Actinomyces oris]|uniref:ATP synthase subunit a n=1 Tax=Actinomyces oris TaxID=544580 RepID=A0A1Q8VZV7_9ACTO|nr:ATP synthase F0 subunit A [Actinomyces oris]
MPRTADAKPFVKPLWYWVLLIVLVAVIAVTAVPAFTEDTHMPGVADFTPEALFGEGTLLQFNRLTFVRLVMGGALCLILGAAAARRFRLVPGRGQALLEIIADFVRSNVALMLLGNKNGRRFAPLLGTLFLGVLAMNLSGVVPGLNIAASSVVAVPMVFAALTYVTFIGAGIKEQGVGHFFVSQLMPPGLPKAMYLLITPIEFLSNFIVRPVTLTLRLLCNMVSGHMLLGMTFYGTTILLHQLQVTSAASALTGAAMIVVTLFEIFVAVLQAYIFTILSAVYIKLSIEAH